MTLHSSFDGSTEAGFDRYSIVSDEEHCGASTKKEVGTAAVVTAVECQVEAKLTNKQRPKETPPRNPKTKLKMFRKMLKSASYPSQRSLSSKGLSTLKRVPTDDTDETDPVPPSPVAVTKSNEDSGDGKNAIPVTTNEAEPAATESADEKQKKTGILTRVEIVDVSQTEKNNTTAETKKSRKGHKPFRFLSRSVRSKKSNEEEKKRIQKITPKPIIATNESICLDEMMLLINDSADDDSIDASSLASKYQIEVDTDRSVVSRIEKEEIIERIRQATRQRSYESSYDGSFDDGEASISDETYLEVQRSLTRISTHASRLGVTERQLLTILSKGTDDNDEDEGTYRTEDPSRTFDDESTIRSMETFEVNNTRNQSFAKEAAHDVIEMVENLFDRDLATIREMIGELSDSTDEGDDETVESTMEEEEVEEEKDEDTLDRYLGPGELAEPYPTGMASV